MPLSELRATRQLDALPLCLIDDRNSGEEFLFRANSFTGARDE